MTIIAGKYEVESELGSGAYGNVYLVKHVDLGVKFALKLLGKNVSSDEKYLDRFRREASILLKFTHSGSVQLRDFGKAEDGRYYLVTDFCEGIQLQRLLDKHGALSVPQAIKYVSAVLDVLEVAHGLGIIHRDIKPSNIMIDVVDDKARVLDFGVALLQEGQSSPKKMTIEGFAVGTPEYMSPEQAAGEAGVDTRADIYSCGILLYELLVGKPPFIGETLVQTLLQHLTQPVPPISPALRVPSSVESVVRRALEKERQNRFQSAKEFREALLLASSPAPIPEKKSDHHEVRVSGNGNRKILCLDDNEMVLQMMRHLMEIEGYKVFTANNFSVIHDIIFREKVRFMLCDVNMPGLPGNTICKMLKRAIPDLTIIMFSNIPERELEQLATECKADGWIWKNSKPATWLTAIREYQTTMDEKYGIQT